MQPTEDLTVKAFALGTWMTNCYVISTPNKKCWIIDAGFDPDELINYIQNQELQPEKIILTHAHLDHIAGLDHVHQTFPGVPIYIHETEKDFLTDTTLNLSAGVGIPIIAPEADHFLEHGQQLTLGSYNFEIRHTPGHSPGGICLYQKENNFVIAGDTLFENSIGRYDFPTSDGRTLYESIINQLYTLPDNTAVFPGHGNPTVIGHEKQNNPFVRPA